MTNDKILMELTLAIAYTLNGEKGKATDILLKIQQFIKSRNPEETKYSAVVSRTKKPRK